ncbi:Zuotin [Dimargaris verticillata]|uniref:Zuotin n=1 Tax=Dimargaris verticillata TaxID=2761393 RepID=A0A9W8E8Z6_9FUNG|nr:Zuotin [Dimargaris verticillata]
MPGPITLTPAPASWPATETQKVHDAIAVIVEQTLELVGERVHQYRAVQKAGASAQIRDHLEYAVQAATASAAQTHDAGHDSKYDPEENDAEYLDELDPNEWKEQDHYQVLGLSKLRFRATPDDIKYQFHRKVLRHHPDKKAAGGNAHDDKVFKCIQKAYEILINPIKRLQFDSVDPGIDDRVPSLKAKGDFYSIYTKVFDREARFSKKPGVPSLGVDSSPRQEVEAFYEFWYNFDSWRTFEYLDKEDVDMGDNRDNKRYLDRKNRAERAKRKNEDNARIRQIVDQAFKLDPRMKRFRQEDRDRRDAKKNAKKGGVNGSAGKKTATPAQIKEDAEAKQKAEAEAKAKAEADAAKAKDNKAQQKKLKQVVRGHKKAIDELFKKHNYFTGSDAAPSAAVMGEQFTKLDKVIAANSKEVEAIEKLRTALEQAASENKVTEVFDAEVAKC